ncbi:putative transport protein [Actinomycetales bacterium JB111]|jgi:MFS family permease|nr:putative transport protein [Actinomycetales bacterium JB111]
MRPTDRARPGLPDLRAALYVALASACGFGAFYGLYTAAPVTLDGGEDSTGARTAVFMACVIAAQPLVPLAGRWLRIRSRAVGGALAAMAAGFAALPLAGSWPGLVAVGAGFGVFVVTSAAWVRELADARTAGRALGLFGLGSAIGATVAAPAALALDAASGLPGVAAGGAVLTALGILPVVAAQRVATRSRPVTALGTRTADVNGPTGSDAPQVANTDDAAPAPAGDRVGARRRPTLLAQVLPTVAVHGLAVLAYGLVLSSAGALGNVSSGTLAVVAAFGIQGAVAVGRPVAGWASDRFSGAGVLLVAAVGVVVSMTWVVLDPDPVRFAVAATCVGAASGAVQTAALTLMMRHAHTPQHAERVSLAWNLVFDIALGIAAALTARIVLI